MAATIPDEFDSPIGALSGYTALKGGFASLVNLAGTQVNRPAPSPETDNLTINIANRHVDIRSMITTDPDHGRPQRDMDLFHMMENAYHQSINLLSGTASGGHWNLTWEDTGPIAYALTTDYVNAHTSTTHTIARTGGSTIPSGATVKVSYTTGTASYVDESHVLTGTTPVALTHQSENVVISSIVVNRSTVVLTSGNIAFDATPLALKAVIEAFVPQVIDSLLYDGLRPAVAVTGSTFPYVISFFDETQPPAVREIGSWVPLFGVDYSALTGSTPVLSVTNLRHDDSWLQSADPADSSLTMEEVETVAGSTQEDWQGLDGSTGVTSVTVGKDADFFNWRSLKVIFDGDPVNLDLTSSTPLTPVDILALNADRSDTFISFVVPEWTTGAYESAPKLNLANSFIEFTSADSGLFAYQGGTGIGDSDHVFLDSNMDATFFQAVLTDFGTDTDWTRITAVHIHLESTGGNDPDADDVLTFMAVRALDNNWNPMPNDINTRTGHLEYPVTLDADALDDPPSPFIRSINEYGSTSAHVSENVTADPNLADGAISVKFNSGSQLLVADTEPNNHIVLYTRQRHNDNGSWDWEQAQLSFGRVTGPTLKGYLAVAKGTTNAGGTVVTLTDITKTSTNFALTSNADYLFKADIQDDILTVTLQLIDGDGNTTAFKTLGPIEDTDFERVRGRVGWYAEFGNKDVEIDYLRSSNISFATLRTAIFHSRTPIDGAQLAVAASEDSNLWTSWDLTVAQTGDPTDDNFNLDTNKKLSATGSYRFVGGGLNPFMGLQTNTVDFDDWNQMYLDFDVWMPPGLSQHNNVQLLTIEPSGSMSGTFKLTHDGAETSAIAFNATAATVQAALAALGTIGTGNVLVTGGPLGTGAPPNSVTIKFIDALAGADISTLVVSNDSVTNGTPVVTQAGVVPQIYLKLPGTEGDYDTGTVGPFRFPFVPGTWSHVHFPLAFLGNQATNPYRVQIVTKQPTTQSFWVDNMKVGHRSVAWELRAIENGTWYPFQDAVNDPRGALHLPHSARGTAIQLQARALRADAWISSYTLKPHYAELGRVIGNSAPTIDEGAARVVGVPSGVEEYTPA